jgi:hypothetical protein
MLRDETSMFIPKKLQEPQHGVDRHQTLDMSSRGIKAYNKINKHKIHKDLLLESSHLEVYVSVEEPTKGGPLHLGHSPPSSDHKDQTRVTYSISG